LATKTRAPSSTREDPLTTHAIRTAAEGYSPRQVAGDGCIGSVIVGGIDAVGSPLGGADAMLSPFTPGDVDGEEMHAVAVEVAAGAVVALSGPGVGVAREGPGVAKWDAGVEGVGDRGVP
jgi:hypothetical protein